MVRRRSRRKTADKTVRVESAAVESQGEGTWLEFPKKLRTERHLGPVMELMKWKKDPRMEEAVDHPEIMMTLLEEMRVDFTAYS